MNKEWSNINKMFQENIKRASTFKIGIDYLLSLRKMLYQQIMDLKDQCCGEDLKKKPLVKNKTIVYYVWHLARIEDLVLHTLMLDKEQIYFKKGYHQLINAPLQTTGNELKMAELETFSKQLIISELYNYLSDVYYESNTYLEKMNFDELMIKVSDERKRQLISLEVVSLEEDAFWLVDYWCHKNYLGLLQMPFSRHWIMHTENCLQILKKLEYEENIK